MVFPVYLFQRFVFVLPSGIRPEINIYECLADVYNQNRLSAAFRGLPVLSTMLFSALPPIVPRNPVCSVYFSKYWCWDNNMMYRVYPCHFTVSSFISLRTSISAVVSPRTIFFISSISSSVRYSPSKLIEAAVILTFLYISFPLDLFIKYCSSYVNFTLYIYLSRFRPLCKLRIFLIIKPIIIPITNKAIYPISPETPATAYENTIKQIIIKNINIFFNYF